MKNVKFFIISTISILLINSCKEEIANQTEQNPIVTVKTTVVKMGDIENYITLNGKTVYLKKNAINSPISGYIAKVNVKFGDKIQKNDVLFEIQTKESNALKNSELANAKSGNIKVLASADGYINELIINESGAYVAEGSLLCNIEDTKDLKIQVNVPYENNSLLIIGKKAKIFLADNTSFEGIISQILPIVKENDQTQNVLLNPNTNKQLPENLNLTVQFVNSIHHSSFLLPKEAVMTNETQTEFWIMKIVNSNLAVKIPILKGIDNDSVVEVISTDLHINDQIIREGAYGLADSTIVKITK